MVPGDRLICAFVRPHLIGNEFTDWPLHVTVVPWFRNDIASEVLAADIGDNLTQTAFTVTMGDEAKLGHGKTGNWVEQPTPFNDIEQKVRATLKQYGSWLVDETTKKQKPYKPHVTAQKDGGLFKGDVWRCDRLYMVQQRGSYKEVVAEVYLV